MGREMTWTHFSVDGSVSFRGLDFSEVWHGWECPWFEKSVGEAAARYLSSDDMRVFFDGDTFILENRGRRKPANKKIVEGVWYYDFTGTWPWKKK